MTLYVCIFVCFSGSTYQDNTNVDQAGVTLGNMVQGKANPNPFQATQPAQVGKPI